LRKKLTVTIDEKVYEAMHRVIGRGSISRFIEDLVRPQVMELDLEANYRDMAKDEEHEKEALEWAEALIGDVDGHPG
jgi:predicted CopG family antitoxin